ncbi:O-acetyl-ADP-ribose deacetylase (regulator of RNase III), contains Macro domain [Lachnospiraceae bacterium]|nr:O-acetyl-ADP-ribose deacetylase (regulator of RNase III), contains Macro domain [Lachnospiraceae bacterium]
MPLKIIRNDITKVSADIIVNSANPKPKYGTGTAHAIYNAAGIDELLVERKKIGSISVGDIAVTPAFNLNAKYIIHTVGPIWFGGNRRELELLKSCYIKSLEKAAELKCETIAFPLISSGAYMFPKDKALQVAMSSITEFLYEHDMTVYIVVFDEKSFELSGRIFADVDSYIDNTAVMDSQSSEYSAFLEYVDKSDRAKVLENISRLSGKEEIKKYLSSIRLKNSEKYHSIFNTSRIHHGSSSDSSRDRTDDLENIIAGDKKTYQKRLLELIDESGMTDPEVYKKANIDRKLFSKIRCTPEYKPKKKTAVALALALELDYDTMVDLLKRAGIAFSPSSTFDKIIEYYVIRGIYDVQTINLSLFEHGEETLGD